MKNITNDLIIRWKKIAKAAAASKIPIISYEQIKKPVIKEINSQEISSKSFLSKETYKVIKLNKIIQFINLL